MKLYYAPGSASFVVHWLFLRRVCVALWLHSPLKTPLATIIGSIVKEDLADLKVLKEYMNLVAKKRAASDPAWKTFYEAAVKVLSA